MALRILFTCILLLTTSVVFAQEADWVDLYFNARNRQYHDMTERVMMKAQWNGKATRMSIQPLFENPEFRAALGLSEEQVGQIDFMTSKGGSMGHWFQAKAQTDPIIKEKLDEAHELQKDDWHLQKASPEVLKRYDELLEEMTVYYFEESQKDLENALTPEQMIVVHETEISLLSEMGMVNPAMFEALDLTEEQRQEMEAIKTEMEEQFDILIEDAIKANNDIKDLFYSYMKDEKISSYEDFDKKYSEISAKPECKEKQQKIRMDHEEKGRQFLSRFRTKMLDVLTDEQLARMENLIKSPPAYLAKILEAHRKEREAMAKSGQWQPGINSWQPGDPIPEEYKEHRKSRFPKK